MQEFNKGDKVIYTSGNWGSSETNPLHTDYPEIEGTVLYQRDSSVNVLWSHGHENTYYPGDLEKIGKDKYSKQKRSLEI